MSSEKKHKHARGMNKQFEQASKYFCAFFKKFNFAKRKKQIIGNDCTVKNEGDCLWSGIVGEMLLIFILILMSIGVIAAKLFMSRLTSK